MIPVHDELCYNTSHAGFFRSTYCAGSTHLSADLAGFTITRFEGQEECSLQNVAPNATGVAFVRNYDPTTLNQGCMLDYSRAPIERCFYLLMLDTGVCG